VKKFLSLPIDEVLLDEMVKDHGQGRRILRAATDPKHPDAAALAQLPFAGTPNPLHRLLSFLTTMVHPAVGAAAAQRAAEVLEAEATAAGLAKGAADPVPPLATARAAAHALQAAATKARKLQAETEAEMQRWALTAAELLSQRVAKKVEALLSLPEIIVQERRENQAQYQQEKAKRDGLKAQFDQVVAAREAQAKAQAEAGAQG